MLATAGERCRDFDQWLAPTRVELREGLWRCSVRTNIWRFIHLVVIVAVSVNAASTIEHGSFSVVVVHHAATSPTNITKAML